MSLIPQHRFRQYRCAECGAYFMRYPMNATRAAKPQYCSRTCLGKTTEKRATEQLISRIFRRVERGEQDKCWEWNGRRDSNGYGRIDIKGFPRLAHRLMFELINGWSPKAVCHSCDNPSCCNPSHLWAGTQADNVADMISKGRRNVPIRRGASVNTSKLTEQDVLLIVASSESIPHLAKQFSVTVEAIRAIRNGKNWRHVTGIIRQ
jgi:DNA-directed RNA polymerase subunit RPC12/RpoP